MECVFWFLVVGASDTAGASRGQDFVGPGQRGSLSPFRMDPQGRRPLCHRGPPRSASTARPSEELSLERCVDVARWPRPVSTLRSERVSSFALKSGIVGRIQLRPARSTVQSPVTYECVCEATVRRRQASPSLPPPTKLPVWLSCAAPPPARWLVFVVVVGAEERARIPKPRRIRENVLSTARPRSYLQSSLLCTT